MFTQKQMDSYAQTLAFATEDGMTTVPPRKHTLTPDERAGIINSIGADRFAQEFGDGDILYVGVIDPDMEDCECERDHILYALVRADGRMNEPVVSGTFMETLLGPPTVWDNARPADVTYWPSV
jgi:hypothetical protein